MGRVPFACYGDATQRTTTANTQAPHRTTSTRPHLSSTIIRDAHPADRLWQLLWLRLHLFMRDVLVMSWGKD